MSDTQQQEPKFTIELDCQPGNPRPNDLLPQVIAGLGLTIDPDQADLRFFGNFTWSIPPDQEQRYEEVREIVKERIESLYNAGLIRYGSW